jgi:hypothetical protein
MTDLPKPDYARNMRIIGHSDQGGRPDGVQIMVHRGYACRCTRPQAPARGELPGRAAGDLEHPPANP